MSKYAYERALVKSGWFMLGSGGFSSVFGHKNHPDIAVKVGLIPDSWPVYAQWAIDHGYSGKHAPLVHSIKPMGGKFYVATMERLACPVYEGRDKGYDYDQGSYFVNKQFSYLTDPSLAAFGEIAVKAGFSYDWCMSNVMFRKDGTIVLNDPQDHTRGGRPTRYSRKRVANNTKAC